MTLWYFGLIPGPVRNQVPQKNSPKKKNRLVLSENLHCPPYTGILNPELHLRGNSCPAVGSQQNRAC